MDQEKDVALLKTGGQGIRVAVIGSPDTYTPSRLTKEVLENWMHEIYENNPFRSPIPIAQLAGIEFTVTPKAMINPKDIPNWITTQRELKNLTQYALAKQLGCSRTRLAEWESGKRTMTVDWWYKIYETLKP